MLILFHGDLHDDLKSKGEIVKVFFCTYLLISQFMVEKSNIGRPQQPLTERWLKFSMIFPDSNPIFFSSKDHSKAELDDT